MDCTDVSVAAETIEHMELQDPDYDVEASASVLRDLLPIQVPPALIKGIVDMQTPVLRSRFPMCAVVGRSQDAYTSDCIQEMRYDLSAKTFLCGLDRDRIHCPLGCDASIALGHCEHTLARYYDWWPEAALHPFTDAQEARREYHGPFRQHIPGF